MNEKLSQILSLPVNAVLVILLLPVVLICRLINCLSLLTDLPSILSAGELMTTIEFVRSEKSSEERQLNILRSNFPNSIAVRS